MTTNAYVPTSTVFNRRKRGWASFRRHLVLTVTSFLMMYPVIWWIGASFKTTPELTQPTLFPERLIWENYTLGWQVTARFSFTRFYFNSMYIGVLIVVGSVLTASLVAYAFGRLRFKFRTFFFSIVLLTLMLPPQVLLVPQYILWNRFGFINSFVPLVLPSFFGGSSFFIFLLVQFIRGIPKDLDEAAKIEGCSTYGIYLRIIMPLIVPALVTVAVFAFVWNWDNFFGHLLYLTSTSRYTVSLGLRMFIDQFEILWGRLLAMSLVSIMPPAAVFFMAQKHFVEGITTTGLKG
ncbi:MAG: carbohydrate ABC transporter permease [Spirochaetaceae bacterium]|nr:MAG: carbohydrate ABC transporter permease [Spirochaetaceae bacterium]